MKNSSINNPSKYLMSASEKGAIPGGIVVAPQVLAVEEGARDRRQYYHKKWRQIKH